MMSLTLQTSSTDVINMRLRPVGRQPVSWMEMTFICQINSFIKFHRELEESNATQTLTNVQRDT